MITAAYRNICRPQLIQSNPRTMAESERFRLDRDQLLIQLQRWTQHWNQQMNTLSTLTTELVGVSLIAACDCRTALLNIRIMPASPI
ncbi:hypothetical protein CRUP_033504 [Coryphaenoides rupestris]|nr:hypothetical protein CRUP_033504 [Coryphaenoides rupestris]